MNSTSVSKYFWEFFMLFLAITLGFFIENYRLRLLDEDYELSMAKSFKSDLQKDQSHLDSIISRRKRREQQINFIIKTIEEETFDVNGKELYLYARYLPRTPAFFTYDVTLKQLKNSGNLNIIKSKNVVDALLNYEHNVLFIDNIEAREERLVQRIFDQLNILFDYRTFNEMNVYDIEFIAPRGETTFNFAAEEDINLFLSNLHYLKTVNVGILGWSIKLRAICDETIKTIENTYQI